MAVAMRNLYPAWTSHARRLEERAAVRRALTQEGISQWGSGRVAESKNNKITYAVVLKSLVAFISGKPTLRPH